MVLFFQLKNKASLENSKAPHTCLKYNNFMFSIYTGRLGIQNELVSLIWSTSSQLVIKMIFWYHEMKS